MDLDQFRRYYMQIEGVGNTPKRAIDRAVNLVKSIAALPGAVGKDRKEWNRKTENVKIAWADLKENGFSRGSAAGLYDAVAQNPLGHTAKAAGRTAKAVKGVALSVNETGSTSRGMKLDYVRRAPNSYDGQDLENGARYLLNAGRPLQIGAMIPRALMKTQEFGIHKGIVIADIAKNGRDHQVGHGYAKEEQILSRAAERVAGMDR